MEAPKVPRPSIRRFPLDGVSVNGAINAFREPQLVLKALLDLPPRTPYTGSRARRPRLRHWLLVHVKDKADELVGLLPWIVCPIPRHLKAGSAC